MDIELFTPPRAYGPNIAGCHTYSLHLKIKQKVNLKFISNNCIVLMGRDCYIFWMLDKNYVYKTPNKSGIILCELY